MLPSSENLRFNVDDLDKNYPAEPNFLINGVQVIKSFLKKDVVDNINNELDAIFTKPLINSVHGSIWNGSIYKFSKQLKRVNCPSRLRSINLLELIIDIADLIPNKEEYHLTDVGIFSEKKNKDALPMHTDKRRGMFRAHIYLKGGEDDSGAFEYTVNSHKINHKVEHHLNSSENDVLSKLKFSCRGNPGDLIIFDPWGFHGKMKCFDERRNILFEFQRIDPEKCKGTIKSSIDLNNRCLTKKVLDNINLFLPGSNEEEFYRGHGLDKENENFPLFFVLKNLKFLFKSFLSKIIS